MSRPGSQPDPPAGEREKTPGDLIRVIRDQLGAKEILSNGLKYLLKAGDRGVVGGDAAIQS